MVKARKDDDETTGVDAAADLSRLAQASTRLFAEQAAAFAVMTAYGMSVAAQMTGMMLGSLRGPADAGGLDEPDTEQTTTPAEQTSSAKVVPLRPRASDAASATSAGHFKPQKITKPAKTKVTPAEPPASKPTRRATAAVASESVTADLDDLKKISGIGPRIEQVLNERGIRRYADVAALGKAALKKLDGEFGLEGRTIRDDWAGQAKALSGGKG